MAGHVAPEAIRGGPIGLVREGDQITLDVDTRRLDVALSDEDLAARAQAYQPPQRPFPGRCPGQVCAVGVKRRPGRDHPLGGLCRAAWA